MPKPEWGTKRTCQSCGAKFYDMMRSPVVCPKCETAFVVETKPRRSRAARPEETVVKKVAVVAETEEELDVEDVEDIEDDEDEEDALLADDEDEEDDLNDVGIGGGSGEDDEDT